MECTYPKIQPFFSLSNAHLYISILETLSVGHAPRANSYEFHGSPPGNPRADYFMQTATLSVEVAHNVKSNSTGRS